MLLIKEQIEIVDLVHLTRNTTPYQWPLAPDTESLARTDQKLCLFHVACESVIITPAVTFNDIHTQIWRFSVVAFFQDVNRKLVPNKSIVFGAERERNSSRFSILSLKLCSNCKRGRAQPKLLVDPSSPVECNPILIRCQTPSPPAPLAALYLCTAVLLPLHHMHTWCTQTTHFYSTTPGFPRPGPASKGAHPPSQPPYQSFADQPLYSPL